MYVGMWLVGVAVAGLALENVLIASSTRSEREARVSSRPTPSAATTFDESPSPMVVLPLVAFVSAAVGGGLWASGARDAVRVEEPRRSTRALGLGIVLASVGGGALIAGSSLALSAPHPTCGDPRARECAALAAEGRVRDEVGTVAMIGGAALAAASIPLIAHGGAPAAPEIRAGVGGATLRVRF